MDKPKPTPGPWAVKNLKSKNTIFIVSENSYVAQTPDFGTEKSPQELADAERIVSCVNAMEGIESPAELRACFDQMIHGLQAILSNWPPERDGMDDEGPLPMGVKLCRKILKEAESLSRKSWM